MTAIDKAVLAPVAYEVDAQIHQANMNLRANFLVLARLLCRMRDERLYIALDFTSFESYLGSVSAEGNRSWLYKLLRAWQMFSVRLGVPDDRLLEAGPSKLDIIAPVVTAENKDEWLDKTVLSKSDLINEVRRSAGKPPLSSLPAPKRADIFPGLPDLASKYPTYMDYVRDQPCMICSAPPPSDAHHWPLTKGAGANPDDAVPLCRICHTEFHQNPLKWLNDFKRQWGAYLHGFHHLIWGAHE